MNVVSKEFQYGDKTVTLETGKIARQATGAVLCSMGETVVLVTCVASRNADMERDFFPLTVDYQERLFFTKAVLVKSAGNQFLAGAGFTPDENGGVR